MAIRVELDCKIQRVIREDPDSMSSENRRFRNAILEAHAKETSLVFKFDVPDRYYPDVACKRDAVVYMSTFWSQWFDRVSLSSRHRRPFVPSLISIAASHILIEHRGTGRIDVFVVYDIETPPESAQRECVEAARCVGTDFVRLGKWFVPVTGALSLTRCEEDLVTVPLVVPPDIPDITATFCMASAHPYPLWQLVNADLALDFGCVVCGIDEVDGVWFALMTKPKPKDRSASRVVCDALRECLCKYTECDREFLMDVTLPAAL